MTDPLPVSLPGIWKVMDLRLKLYCAGLLVEELEADRQVTYLAGMVDREAGEYCASFTHPSC